MTIWDYLILDMEAMNSIDLERRCRNLGSEGWELIAIWEKRNSNHGITIVHYFKRPLRQKGEVR